MSINTSLGSAGDGIDPSFSTAAPITSTQTVTTTTEQTGYSSTDTTSPSTATAHSTTVEAAQPKLKQPEINDLIASLMAQFYLTNLNNQNVNASGNGPSENVVSGDSFKLAMNKVESQILDQLVVSVQKGLDEIKNSMLKQWEKNLDDINQQKNEELKAEIAKTPPPSVQILVDRGAVAFHSWLQSLPADKRTDALNKISPSSQENLNDQYDKLNKSITVLDALNSNLLSVQSGSSPDVKAMMGIMVLGLIMAGGVHTLLSGNAAAAPVNANSLQGSLNAMNSVVPTSVPIPPETANLINLMATPLFYKASLENLSSSVGKGNANASDTAQNYNVSSAKSYAQSIATLVSNKQFETILSALITLPNSQGLLNRPFDSAMSAKQPAENPTEDPSGQSEATSTAALIQNALNTQQKTSSIATAPTVTTPQNLQEAMDRVKFSVVASGIAVLYQAKFGGVTGIEFKELFDNPNMIAQNSQFGPSQNTPSIQQDLANLVKIGSSFLPNPNSTSDPMQQLELQTQKDTILASLQEYYNQYHNMGDLFDVNRVFQQIWNPIPISPTTTAV